MDSYSISKLKEWLELTSLTQEQFVKKYNTVDAFKSGLKYQKLENLNRTEGGKLPGLIFFHDTGAFALLYVNQENILERLSEKEIHKFFGQEEASDRSRAGKTATHYIYAKKGFAYSKTNGAPIHFLEIFPSMEIEEYYEKIYDRPGPFIR